MVPKVKSAYPAAVVSSGSSLIRDSPQRLVYHSLQSRVYRHVFFMKLAMAGARQAMLPGKHQMEAGDKYKQKPPSFLISVVKEDQDWAPPWWCSTKHSPSTSQILWETGQPHVLLLPPPKPLAFALHKDMSHVLVSHLPYFFFTEWVHTVHVHSLVGGEWYRKERRVILKQAHGKKVKTWQKPQISISDPKYTNEILKRGSFLEKWDNLRPRKIKQFKIHEGTIFLFIKG